jgi:RimJ/RimL family protein N-acetyltransferase
MNMDPIAIQPELESAVQPLSHPTTLIDARETPPVLQGLNVTLRPMRSSDARSLHAFLTAPEVARFISPPPATVDGFDRFITRINRQRTTKFMCFAVTAKGNDTAIGMFQLHERDADFQTAEWGFALGSPFWGTGVFEESAQLLLQFAFNTLGVHRLEARAAIRNGRGGRALQKLGAVQEGILRRSFLCGGEYLDQVLYTIVQEDWRASRADSVRAAQSLILH